MSDRRPRPSVGAPLVVAIVAAAFLIGCGDDVSESGAVGFEVVDSAGIEIAISTEPLWDVGEGWEVADEPSLVIGAIESDDPARLFESPSAAFTLSDGTIIVAERRVGEVRAFSPSGDHLWTSGGLGDGPSEFNSASRAFRLPGDTILVQDAPRTRLVRFTSDGGFARDETVDMAAMIDLAQFVECVNMVLPDGSMLRCVEHPTAGRLPASPGPGLIRRRALYARVPRDQSRVDTLGEYGGLEQFGIQVANRSNYAIHPFHSRTVNAIAADPVRVAIAINPEYDIEIWRPDGRLERILRRPGGTRPPTAAELDEAWDMLQPAVRVEPHAARFRAEMPPPRLIPAVGSMVFATTGELLVGRGAASGDTPPGRRVVDVFDTAGRWLGPIDAPMGAIHEVGTDYVLVVRYDDLRVPYVERYELRRSR